jgi:hypothetical protein
LQRFYQIGNAIYRKITTGQSDARCPFAGQAKKMQGDFIQNTFGQLLMCGYFAAKDIQHRRAAISIEQSRVAADALLAPSSCKGRTPE